MGVEIKGLACPVLIGELPTGKVRDGCLFLLFAQGSFGVLKGGRGRQPMGWAEAAGGDTEKGGVVFPSGCYGRAIGEEK